MRCYQYMYLSLATRAFDQSDIDALAQKAASNNAQIGLTGMLIHADGYFMQVLEGDKHFVQHTASIIHKDPRHTEVLTILEGPASRRLFQSWSMGAINLGAPRDSEVLRDAQILADFLALSEPACIRNQTVAALRYMRTRMTRARERLAEQGFDKKVA